MGFESMVTVQAEAIDVEKIQETAKVLLELLLEKESFQAASRSFLEAIVEGIAFQGGNKGDVLLWGGIWNYFREESFTPWVARLLENSRGHWGTSTHISWEPEQSEERKTKVFWFENGFRGGRLIWAEIPSHLRMHWGICSSEAPHVGDRYPHEVILDIDGERTPDHDTCRKCRTIFRDGFHFEGGKRRCPSCGDERNVLRAHAWKDEEDEE